MKLQEAHPDNDAIEELLTMDIEALSELIDQLMQAYHCAGLGHLFRDALARLEQAIDDPRWDQRMIYHRSVAVLCLENDEDAAARIFLGITKWTKSDRVDVLQLGVQLAGSALSKADLFTVLDRVRALDGTLSNEVQYQTAKALHLYFDGAESEAATLLRQTVGSIDKKQLASSDTRTKTLVASTLSFFVQIVFPPDKLALLEWARVLLRETLETETLTIAGRAHIHFLVGECYEASNQFDEAMEEYVLAIDHADGFDSRLGLARIDLERDDPAAAIHQLNAMSKLELSPANQFDQALLMGTAALAQENTELARLAVARLSTLDTPYAVLTQRKNALLDALKEFLTTSAPATAQGWRSLLSTINRYLHLRPNVSGFGINLNEILSDALQHESRTEVKKPPKR